MKMLKSVMSSLPDSFSRVTQSSTENSWHSSNSLTAWLLQARHDECWLRFCFWVQCHSNVMWCLKVSLAALILPSLFSVYSMSQSIFNHYLFKVSLSHPCNLFVNLLGILNTEILRDGYNWTLRIGTTPLVPVGTRCAELRRTQDVDAAMIAQ